MRNTALRGRGRYGISHCLSASKVVGGKIHHPWSHLVLSLLFLSMTAGATGTKKHDEQEQRQDQTQHQGQSQEQESSSASQAEAHALGEAAATASNDGVNTSVNTTTTTESYHTVLVPNNNTENCLRVWGLSFSKDGSIALGIPFRSGKCDLEGAADDAFAQGQVLLGWTFKCKNRNIYKVMGGDEEACIDTVKPMLRRAEADELTRLRHELELLREQTELTDEKCERQWESCVQGK